MSLEPAQLRYELDEALRRLAEKRGEGLVRQIRPVLLADLERGRAQTFMDRNRADVSAYVECVADRFLSLGGFIHQIQVERNEEVWNPLFERMQRWAYNFFVRKGFSPSQTQELAAECATEAAANILNAFFPYDTDFDAWAHIIVQNACRKQIDRAFRKSTIPADQMVELDDNLVGLNDDLPIVETDELQNALSHLTPARRSVIQLLYFEGLQAEEAARRMEKSVGAIYSLQFHALQDLRKILSTFRDNLNE